MLAPAHFGIVLYCISRVPLGAYRNNDIGLVKPNQANLTRTGEQIDQLQAKFETEVLIEQQFHFAAVTRRRSRSAA
jgi:hypothetical protein